MCGPIFGACRIRQYTTRWSIQYPVTLRVLIEYQIVILLTPANGPTAVY